MLPSTQRYAAPGRVVDGDDHVQFTVPPPRRPTQPALLTPGTPRSDEPDLEPAAAYIAMHPITGAFADPSHESAFAAQQYRLAYLGHFLLIGLGTAIILWTALILPPEVQALWGAITILTALGLVGRVLLHRMPDLARSQQMGAWSWTLLLVLDFVAYVGSYVTDTATACVSNRDGYLVPILGFMIAVVNGSHGMGFVHKAALVCLFLTADTIIITICGDSLVNVAPLKCDIAALCVGSVVAHMAELHLRRSYADKVRTQDEKQETRRLAEERRQLEGRLEEQQRRMAERLEEQQDEDKRRLEERNEQLLAEKERLLYDMQRRGGSSLDDGDDRRAIQRGLQQVSRPPTVPADSARVASSESGETVASTSASMSSSASSLFNTRSPVW